MNIEAQPQKLLGCYGLTPASPVLFELTAPVSRGGIKSLSVWWESKGDSPQH